MRTPLDCLMKGGDDITTVLKEYTCKKIRRDLTNHFAIPKFKYRAVAEVLDYLPNHGRWHLDRLLKHAVASERVDLVLIALRSGADPRAKNKRVFKHCKAENIKRILDEACRNLDYKGV